jgi:hypothetical protein
MEKKLHHERIERIVMSFHRITGRFFIALILLISAMMSTQAAQATESNSRKILVYISPFEYTHSVNLGFSYYEYWFNQGPVVEHAAVQILGAQFEGVSMCEGTSTGNTLVWLQPTMFYNPMMGAFYGKIVANVYSGDGKYLSSYVGRSEKIGFVDVYPMQSIEAVYKQTMQNVSDKLKADPAFQAAINESRPGNESATPCGLVPILQGPKTSIIDHFN